jgi:hypothetical protein
MQINPYVYVAKKSSGIRNGMKKSQPAKPELFT